MKILFVDEYKKEGEGGGLFAQLGTLVDSEKLVVLERELRRTLQHHGLKDLKAVRNNSQLPKEKKIQVYREIAAVLRVHDARFLSIILGMNALPGASYEISAYKQAIPFLVERLFINCNSAKTPGLVLHDRIQLQERSTPTKSIQMYFTQHVLTGNQKFGPWSWPLRKWIYPALFFTDDEYTTLLQVSDLVLHILCIAVTAQLTDMRTRGINITDFDAGKLVSFNPYLAEFWDLFIRTKLGTLCGAGIKAQFQDVWWNKIQ